MQPKQKCDDVNPLEIRKVFVPLWSEWIKRDKDPGGEAEVFLGSFLALSRDLQFLRVHCWIQTLFPKQGWQFHPAGNSFLPHLKKRVITGK